MPVISPDEISVRLKISPVSAGKEAIKQQERRLHARETFCIDTTFSGRREVDFLRKAKSRGYDVCLIFVCLPSPLLCQLRVQQRHLAGEHDVPKDDIERRYYRSLDNLRVCHLEVDKLLAVDNSGRKPRLVLSLNEDQVSYKSKSIPEWLSSHVTYLGGDLDKQNDSLLPKGPK